MPEHSLPAWASVAVVIAHPDDESFGLGAVIDAFVRAGARVQVVCLSEGEASTLGEAAADLASVRTAEFQEAAHLLGVDRAVLLGFPDGRLAEVSVGGLLAGVEESVEPADGVLAFDSSGVTGHPDHIRATEVAVTLARRWGCGVLGWALPYKVARELLRETGVEYAGHRDIDIELTVDREVQRKAIAAHRSQAVPGSPLWRRIELQGPLESLVWLVRPAG